MKKKGAPNGVLQTVRSLSLRHLHGPPSQLALHTRLLSRSSRITCSTEIVAVDSSALRNKRRQTGRRLQSRGLGAV